MWCGGAMLILPSDVRWNTLADTLKNYLDNWHILSKVCSDFPDDIESNIATKVNNLVVKNNARDYYNKLKIISVALDQCHS